MGRQITSKPVFEDLFRHNMLKESEQPWSDPAAFMTKGLKYVEEGLEKAEAWYREQALAHLERMANKMGMILQPRVNEGGYLIRRVVCSLVGAENAESFN